MAKWKAAKPLKPRYQTTRRSTFKDSFTQFMVDWGRLAVPLGILALLFVFRATGIVDDTGLGFLVGMIFFVGCCGAWVVLTWLNVPHRKAKVVTVAGAVLTLVGGIVPYASTLYPGEPAFSRLVERGDKVRLPYGLEDHHMLEVYASSLARRPMVRAVSGGYRLSVAGQTFEGEFKEARRTVAGRRRVRNVEEKRLMDVHHVYLEGGGELLVKHIDGSIGPQLRISLYKSLLPPWVTYGFLVIASLFGLFVDSVYRDETQRWRMSPWPLMVLGFMGLFWSAFQRGSVTNTAMWSSIFGAGAGFIAAWVISWFTRKVVGKVQTRV